VGLPGLRTTGDQYALRHATLESECAKQNRDNRQERQDRQGGRKQSGKLNTGPVWRHRHSRSGQPPRTPRTPRGKKTERQGGQRTGESTWAFPQPVIVRFVSFEWVVQDSLRCISLSSWRPWRSLRFNVFQSFFIHHLIPSEGLPPYEWFVRISLSSWRPWCSWRFNKLLPRSSPGSEL
jgi:hypothetical protein